MKLFIVFMLLICSGCATLTPEEQERQAAFFREWGRAMSNAQRNDRSITCHHYGNYSRCE